MATNDRVCPPKPRLENRSLLTRRQADDLGAVFKVLTSGTRLRLLHALARAGEMCVTDLANAVRMKPQAVSNQLQRLVEWRVLEARVNGNFVHYRIADPCTTKLLDSGLCLTEDAAGSKR